MLFFGDGRQSFSVQWQLVRHILQALLYISEAYTCSRYFPQKLGEGWKMKCLPVNQNHSKLQAAQVKKRKKSKGQKVRRSPWLCSWRDILASFLIMLSPALRMRSGCFHTITESPAIVEILYHFKLCKSLFHHFICNNSSMGFLLP